MSCAMSGCLCVWYQYAHVHMPITGDVSMAILMDVELITAANDVNCCCD